jgi:hypothetical protein
MITSLARMLTGLVIFVSLTNVSHSDVFTQESFKSHLRWNFSLPREGITLEKAGDTLTISTLDLAVFEKLAGEMGKMAKVDGYVQTIAYSQEGFPGRPATVTVRLQGPSVEIFNFYRDAERRWIVDFWLNSDNTAKVAATTGVPPRANITPLPAEAPVVAKPIRVARPIPVLPQKTILDVVEVPAQSDLEPNPQLRDYRYGAALLWDYPALLPSLERDIQISSKTPDALYPVADRKLLDDPKEAHVQLSINLYRQEKWGLLNKSLELYKKKYGVDANFDINEWIRLNALMRPNLARRDRTLEASAINLLSALVERTTDYELKRAGFRYLLQYQVDRGDFFRALETAKEFFVEARAQFDHDMVVLAAGVVLQSLARLRQSDKIAEFLADKKLAALLPPQTEFAYASYALLSQGKSAALAKRYLESEKNLAKPVHPAILYNCAEALFREARYSDATRVFDAFLVDWSHFKEAAPAHLRLAQIWELTGRPAAEGLVLYRNAIDRTPYPEYRYEAKLRYVGMRLARARAASAADLESEVFLEQAQDEKKAITPDLRRLLWLVRLRTFISTRRYDEALAYLASLPLDGMRPAERRVFEGDGSEIIFGLIQQAHLKEDYTKAVKIWEVYKAKYEKSVASNPYLNFVVADSFIKLGLYQSFERAYGALKGMRGEELREYPLWVERTKTIGLADMLEELALIKYIASGEWDQAEAKLASFPVSRRDSVNFAFYQGKVLYQRGKWNEASAEFEKVLVRQNPDNRLTPRQMAELLMSYVEALAQLQDTPRFKSVVKALASDIGRSKSAPILNVAERVHYLLIEGLVGDEQPEWKEVEVLTREFRTRFQKSPYSGRMEYLLGLSLLRDGRIEEGKGVLRALVAKKDIPGYVREMARTELSSLELRSKQL